MECLFQFVCSSNNHISRIHGMVERLCRAYGTPLPVLDKAAAAGLPEVQLQCCLMTLLPYAIHIMLNCRGCACAGNCGIMGACYVSQHV